MPFIEFPGKMGLFYVNDPIPESKKKHNCRDCYSCKWCSDERCQCCLTLKCAADTSEKII